MVSAALLFVSLAATALAVPTTPTLTYLFTANFSVAAPINIGATPLGTRQVVTMTGGTVSGPKVNGNLPFVSLGEAALPTLQRGLTCDT